MPSPRALLGLGVASILVTIIYLAGKDREPMDRAFARGASLFVFVSMIFYGLLFDQVTGDWLRYRYVLLMAIFYFVISYLMLTKKWAAFSILILLILAPYYLVNPIAYGLDPIYNNKIVIAASEIQSREPNSKWVEYGGNTLANLLKTAGLNVVNGNKYTPDLEFYRTLDPGRENQFIYNRYSDVVFGEAKPGSGKEADFVLIQPDSYAVLIDPCSQKLKELGVTNFAFAYKPAAEKVFCLELITGLEESNVWFFGRKCKGIGHYRIISSLSGIIFMRKSTVPLASSKFLSLIVFTNGLSRYLSKDSIRSAMVNSKNYCLAFPFNPSAQLRTIQVNDAIGKIFS